MVSGTRESSSASTVTTHASSPSRSSDETVSAAKPVSSVSWRLASRMTSPAFTSAVPSVPAARQHLLDQLRLERLGVLVAQLAGRARHLQLGERPLGRLALAQLT